MHTILIVDDSPSALKLLNALLSKDQTYQIYQAGNAEEGIEIARDIRPDIIISDYYMPGKDGLEFCREIKNDTELSNTIFILLTAETDVAKKIEGLEGGVDDYIEKTISTKVLLGKVKAFLKIKTLQNELMKEKQKLQVANEQLKKNFKELVVVLLKILEMQIPGAGNRADIARAIAKYIAGKLELDEEVKKNIVFGAVLHEIGKIGLPEKLIKSDLKGLEPHKIELYYRFPVIGSIIVSTFTGYSDAAYDVCHQCENFDGSGTPDGLMKDEITIGAKILRAIIFQEELFMMGLSSQEVIEQIRSAMNTKLDPVISTYLVNYLMENEKGFSISKNKIPIEELKAGMVLEEDLYSVSGIKILPKGVVLTERMVEIILERDIVDPIVGGVSAYKP
ncbi:MAG: response regulator [Proteobacteria bacterium]|nr:response regulator [Pseudomonadota bacterium]